VRATRKRIEQTRRIVLLAFPGAQILDVAGPLEVFSAATRWVAPKTADARPAYTVEIVARDAGAFACSSGLRLIADRSLAETRGPIDTLLVAGGRGIDRALANRSLLRWLRGAALRARRVASVCTGAFLLAEAGLLAGRRATTHWAWCDAFARRYPGVRVDRNPIFVRDGKMYTSAGVTAGMDLALALVEEDHGRRIALEVARHLVLFLRRPGGQSQFSAQLAVQQADREPVRDLQGWIADHPDADLSVPSLARRAAMSPRNFARVFRREVGTTPACFVERVRVEAARRRLEESAHGIEAVAAQCGFGSAESMRRAFLRTVRVAPSSYRSRFRALPAPSGASSGGSG
jgi:transcriptional regulator GlxA family with amidase domain